MCSRPRSDFGTWCFRWRIDNPAGKTSGKRVGTGEWRWRKYGEKRLKKVNRIRGVSESIKHAGDVKRAYFKCTVASCPAKKYILTFQEALQDGTTKTNQTTQTTNEHNHDLAGVFLPQVCYPVGEYIPGGELLPLGSRDNAQYVYTDQDSNH